MTITEQADFILNHRSFKQAIENFQNGHTEDLRYILIILQREAANKTKESQIRCYRQWKRCNIADIIELLQVRPIPDNMDIRLPAINKIEPVCKKLLKMRVAKTNLDIFEEVA